MTSLLLLLTELLCFGFMLGMPPLLCLDQKSAKLKTDNPSKKSLLMACFCLPAHHHILH